MNPRSTPVTLVDAFTRTPGHGNRAGVIEDAHTLDRAAMLALARAVAASETAFVLPPAEGAELRLRYFTPATEVSFCGHATVATFHRLVETGRLSAPSRLVLECEAGKLEIELETVHEGTRVWIETPRSPWSDVPIDPEALIELLGGDAGMLDRELPARRSGPKLFLPLARRDDLWRLSPSWDELADAGLPHEVWGVLAFTRDTLERVHVVQSRFFAPALGVREDPVTGAAHGPLAEYLAQHGVLPMPGPGAVTRARAEQGDAMGKPGRVDLEVTGGAQGIARARVGGVAVTVLEGQLRLGERMMAESAG